MYFFSVIDRPTKGLTKIAVEQVQQRVQQTVTQVSAFLTPTSDINIARHVDIDGIRQGEVVANDQYSQSVDNARRLVRTLETVLQALYDDTAALHLTTQNIRDSNDGSQVPGDRESSYDLLDKLSTALSSNLSQCRQAIEAILSVGREQAELAAGDYRGSIEWRMSRLSVIHAQFGNGGIAGVGNGANHTAKADDAYDSENEGVVDLGFALDRPGGRKKSVTQDSSYESGATFANGASTSSLNPTDTDDLDSTLVSHDLHDDGDFFDDRTLLPFHFPFMMFVTDDDFFLK
jgi:son of sevenless-like protein